MQYSKDIRIVLIVVVVVVVISVQKKNIANKTLNKILGKAL